MFAYCGNNTLFSEDPGGEYCNINIAILDGPYLTDRFIIVVIGSTGKSYSDYARKVGEAIEETAKSVYKVGRALGKSLDCKAGVGAGFEFSAGNELIDLTVGGHENPAQIHLQNGSLSLEDEKCVGLVTGIMGHEIGPYYHSNSPYGHEEVSSFGIERAIADPVISLSNGSVYVGIGFSFDVSINFSVFLECLLEDFR